MMLLGNTFRKTEIGVLNSNGGSTPTNRITNASTVLHSRYYRTTISLDVWTGSSSAYNTVKANGMKAHMGIDLTSGTYDAPEPWPSVEQAAIYANIFDTEVMPLYPEIEMIILDNEELAGQHLGTIEDYLAIAEIFKPICKKHGVKLTNGGFGDLFSQYCHAYRYIASIYGTATADAFGAEAFTTNGQLNAAKFPGSNPTLEAKYTDFKKITDSLVWDEINVHMYEPVGPDAGSSTAPPITSSNTMVWRYLIESLKYGTAGIRRKVLCNESGQRWNEQPILVTQMMDMAWRYNLDYYDWWSGNGTAGLGALPLLTNSGAIKTNGEAFRNKQDSLYS